MSRQGPVNVVLVFADQMRASAMGCAENPDVQTPHMDALAAQGVRLTDCIANAPVCGPSRAIMLTGTWPTRNGVIGNDLPIRTDLPSLGSVARTHGYRTGYVGKWHLDGTPRSKFTPPGPRRLGFEDFWAAYNCAHDYFRPKYYRDTPELIEVPGYEPMVQTDLAIEFLREHAPGASKADQPFCLVVSWGPPHDPYPQVPTEYRDRYDPASIHLPPSIRPDAPNPLAAGMDCRRTIADYYAAVTALDDQLGRLIRCLEEIRHRDDTLVIFTSDHGDMLWSHGLMKKQSPYEESINIPFIARLPGRIPAGTTSHVLLSTIDLLPTICGLCRWAIPTTVQGRDLSAWFGGEQAASKPDSVLICNQLSADAAQHQRMPEWRGVRTARYTYVEQCNRKPWLLFDNQTDPHQLQNLINLPEHAQTQQALAQKLGQWLEVTKDSGHLSEQLLEEHGLTAAWQHREETVWT